MPWTTPQSVSTNSIASSASFNSQVVDNLSWLANDAPSCRVYRNTNLSIANNTETYVAFPLERFDNFAMHDVSINNTRITIPSGGGGLYFIHASVAFSANATGIRRLSIIQNQTTLLARDHSAGFTSYATFLNASAFYRLSAGEYVEISVFQDSGGALDCAVSANATPEFTVLWVRN